MIDAKPSRVKSSLLVLAASTLVGLALHEGYTDKAVIPVPGDVPTKGFGTTRNPDGSSVKMGDTTTPQRALVDLLRDASKFEQAVKRCAPVPMHPYEFSAYVSFTYNVGEGAFCKSTLARKLNAGDYEGACAELLKWDKAGGRTVRGLTLRRQEEYRECMGLANDAGETANRPAPFGVVRGTEGDRHAGRRIPQRPPVGVANG